MPTLTPTVPGYPCAGEKERKEKPPKAGCSPNVVAGALVDMGLAVDLAVLH